MDEKELMKKLEELLDQREKGLVDKPTVIKALTDKLTETLKANFDDVGQLKKNLETLSAEIKTIRGGVENCNIDQLDGVYKGPWKSARLAQDFGLYVMASVLRSDKAAKTLKSRGYTIEKAAMGDDNPTGGLFVPTQIIDGFIMLLADHGVGRRNAMTLPMTSDSASGFKLDSGLTVYCTAEGVVPDAQTFKNRILNLTAKEWNVYVAIDKTLDEDAAIMLGNVIAELMAMAFAEKEDDIIFNGTGTSTYFGYRGIVGWLTSLTTPKGLISADGNAWSAITLPNHLSMMGELHPDAWKGEGPKWFCSPQYYFGVMMKLATAAGGATIAELLGSMIAGKRQFLGIPVEFAPLPSASASGHIPCVLGNLKRGVLIGDRRRTTIEQSQEALFLERQIAVLATERVAINVYGCHDVTTDGTTRAGTIVALKTT